MTRNDLLAKWLIRFADNDTFEIDEADFREFTQDAAATFAEAGYQQFKELALPQAVLAGQWYLDGAGIWEPRRSFLASVSPVSGPNWRQVVSFTGQSTQVVTAASIIDATDAGRKMLKANTAKAQRALVSNPGIEAGQYGNHPAWTDTDNRGGLYEWLIQKVLSLQASQPQPVSAPQAPTAGQVDDTADTFSFLPNPAYPSFAQYKVNGLPGITGAVVLDSTNSYVQGSRIYIKVVGTVAKGGLAVYVAGSGNVPDGAVLTNADPFTGTAVPPTPALTAALAISLASLTLGSSVAFSITPAGGSAPYAYQVVATDNATGQQFTLGSTQSGSWTPTVAGSYALDATVTDSSSPAKMAQAATRYLQVQAAQNRIPVADAGQDVTIQLPTSSVALMGTGSDPDAGDSVVGYAWRQITGPTSAGGLPALTQNVVATGLVEGTYQFGFRTTDTHGAQSVEDFVLLTVQPVPGNALTEYPLETLARQACSQALPHLGGSLLNTLAYYEFETAATLLDLQAATSLGSVDNGYADGAELGVWCGPAATLGSAATFLQRANLGLAPNAGPAPVWVPVNVPAAAGLKRYRVAVPPQCRNGAGTQNVAGTVFLKIRANAPITWITNFAAPSGIHYVLQDSIAFANPVNPWTDAWVIRLRERLRPLGQQVIVVSMAGASLVELYGTPPGTNNSADKAALRNQFSATAQKVSVATILGCNDGSRYNPPITPALFGQVLGNLLDDLHAQYPTQRQLVISPFRTGNFEANIAPLRAKEVEVVAARPYVEYYNGLDAYVGAAGPSNPGEPNDNSTVHPGTVQHASIENFYWGSYNGVDPNLFYDTFPGTSLHQRWNNGLYGNANNAALVVVNNELQITATVGSGHQSGITSALPYSLLAYVFRTEVGTLFVNRPEAVQYIAFHPEGKGVYEGYQLVLGGDAVNGYQLSFISPQFTLQAKIAYDPVAHKYFQFAGGGTTVIPQTSPDGVTWSNPFAVTHNAPFSLRSVRFIVGGGGVASTDTTNWPDGTPLGTCSFRNVGLAVNPTGGTAPVMTTYLTSGNTSINGPGAFLGSGKGIQIADVACYTITNLVASSAVTAIIGDLGQAGNGVAKLSLVRTSDNSSNSAAVDQASGTSGQEQTLFKFPTVAGEGYTLVLQKRDNDTKPIILNAYVTGLPN